MMRVIGQEELRRMPLRRPWEYQLRPEKHKDWLERRPALAAVVGTLWIFGMPVVMLEILYAVAKAMGM